MRMWVACVRRSPVVGCLNCQLIAGNRLIWACHVFGWRLDWCGMRIVLIWALSRRVLVCLAVFTLFSSPFYGGMVVGMVHRSHCHIKSYIIYHTPYTIHHTPYIHHTYTISYTIPYHTTPYHTPYLTIRHHTIHHTIPYHTIPYTISYHTIQPYIIHSCIQEPSYRPSFWGSRAGGRLLNIRVARIGTNFLYY